MWCLESKKFHEYCFRRLFTIQTDHKPLLGKIGAHKGISIAPEARSQRWLLFLSHYQYKLTYHPDNFSSNADALSHLPLPPNSKKEQDINLYGINSLQLENSLVSSWELDRESRQENIIACVTKKVLTENWKMWREHERLKNFVCRQNELGVEKRCLLWGARVFNPLNLMEKVSYQLHNYHPLASRMKTLARSYVWWPNLDREIEQTLKNC